METTSGSRVQPHNERAAAVWSAGGGGYDEIGRGIADALEHCVLRLDPKPGERILDLSTGTGWALRLVARRRATVVGADIAPAAPVAPAHSRFDAPTRAETCAEYLASIDEWRTKRGYAVPAEFVIVSGRKDA